MTLEELKQNTWFKTRPPIIQEAILKLPPICLYKFKDTEKQCYIISFEEPIKDNYTIDEVTVVVQKTGKGGVMDEMGLGQLDTNQVFSVKLDDLEPWETIN